MRWCLVSIISPVNQSTIAHARLLLFHPLLLLNFGRCQLLLGESARITKVDARCLFFSRFYHGIRQSELSMPAAPCVLQPGTLWSIHHASRPVWAVNFEVQTGHLWSKNYQKLRGQLRLLQIDLSAIEAVHPLAAPSATVHPLNGARLGGDLGPVFVLRS